MFESSLVFLEGVVGAIYCLGVFEFGSKFATGIFQQVNKIGQKVPQGILKSVQAGTLQGVRKTGRGKDALPDETAMQLAPKLEPKSESLA